MELPFAVEDDTADASPFLPTSSPTYQNVSLPSTTTTTTSTSNTSITSGAPSSVSTTNSNSTAAHILHRVALYDNVHPHYYTPKNLPLKAQHEPPHRQQQQEYQQQQQYQQQQKQQYQQQRYQQQQYQQQQQQSQSIMEDDFVTINAEEDVTTHTTSSNTSHQDQNQHQFHYPSQPKHHSLYVNKTSAAYGHHTDLLALLLSSVTSTSSSSSPPPSDGMMELCERAANKAQEAAKAMREGNVDHAAKNHLEASKCYRDAALLLKNGYSHKEENENSTNGNDNDNGNHNHNHNQNGMSGKGRGAVTWGGDVKFLAFSLLMLSNSQARSADCLVKSGSVSVNLLGAIVKNADNGKDGMEGRDDNYEGEDGNHGGGSAGRRLSGKEDRLRAKIRASMVTAEADMTDSTFLGKATSVPQPPVVNANVNVYENANVQERIQPVVQSAAMQGHKSSVNPIDDMMELEQELRDMDATLNMGVNLSSSTSSIMTKKSLEDGSFCVVPGSSAGGSSFMSSSMMWASGIGGARQTHPHGHAYGRARANRVQTILHASSAGIQKSTSVGNHQQLHQNPHITSTVQSTKHHPGLESSWWGQASALASSTTSLSNSMVGVRSANIGANPMHTNGTVVSPANTKQLMRLLDSLRTLGDENTSLLREVEDAKKARIEAKAARESMKQFRQEYNKRFDTLKAALDKVRSEQPNQKGKDGGSNGAASVGNNIVSRSNFVKSKTSAELQKREKMIQKLSADLMTEKAESKKKDASLRKYENFYKEVKLRSEMKKRQQEDERKRSKSQR